MHRCVCVFFSRISLTISVLRAHDLSHHSFGPNMKSKILNDCFNKTNLDEKRVQTMTMIMIHDDDDLNNAEKRILIF